MNEREKEEEKNKYLARAMLITDDPNRFYKDIALMSAAIDTSDEEKSK